MNSVLKTEIWKYLPFEAIINLSRINHQLSQIVSDTNFWEYILQRDFDINSDEPKMQYQKLYRILKFFSPIIPIITQPTLHLIDKFVPTQMFNQLKSELREYRYPPRIFDTHLLLEIFETMISKLEAESDQEDEYWEQREAEGIDEEQDKLIELMKSIKNGLKDKYSDVVLKKASYKRNFTRRFPTTQLVIGELYYRKPTIIYVNSLKKYTNIDLDLLTTIVKFGVLCGENVNCYEIEEKLLTEI